MSYRLEDLDVAELHAELDEARAIADAMFDQLLSACDQGDLLHIAAVACAAKAAQHRVKAIRRVMTLGIA